MAKARNPRGMPSPELLETCNTLHRSTRNLLIQIFLSATSALVVGVAIRYKADDQELERVGVTYLLHKGNDSWKFAAMVLHDTDKVAPRE